MKLSEREKEVLNKIANSDSVKSAASNLNLSTSTVYNMLYRIRKKHKDSRKLVNTVLAYRRKSQLLDMVLSRRVTVAEED
ncbi:MAG: LuxR C-terminal-related transcriptional regulator [Candidatus Bathyarchaeota archaeon]|nr:LuxR C-terminal-related transcriptional regulator [Candidatus Bathyarchaeum sp.]